MGRVRVNPPEQLSKHFFSTKEKMDQKDMDHKGEVGGGVPGLLGSTTKKNLFVCPHLLEGFRCEKKKNGKQDYIL